MNAAGISRRRLLQIGGAALARPLVGQRAPVSTVAVERCRSYGHEFHLALERALDRLGGIGDLVRGKTVAVKPNLTGSAFYHPEVPYRTHPDSVLSLVTLLARYGARRVRIIEGFFPASQQMQYWAAYGLDIAAIENCGCPVEWENTNHRGKGARYVRLPVPGGGYVFPAFDLNHSYADCDVFISLSKLKNHWLAGITLSMKNNFGITPASLYGGDAYPGGNENPTKYRGKTLHEGTVPIAESAPQELDPSSPREPGYRVPRIVTDLVGARPVDLAIIDGVETIRGGEGPWNPGIQTVRPGVLIVGRNPVCADTVATAVMGYDPRAGRGEPPFVARQDYGGADNMLLLAEAAGYGSADLGRIEVRGLSIEQARFGYGPGPVGEEIDFPGAPLAATSAAWPSGMLAPGSLVSLWGEGFREGPVWATDPDQRELDGLRVEVTDSAGATRAARVLFANPWQVNIVLPEMTTPGIAELRVFTAAGETKTSAEQVYPLAPGVFTADGTGGGPPAAYVVRVQPSGEKTIEWVFACHPGDGRAVCEAAPIELGGPDEITVLVLFLTGIGGLSPGSTAQAWIGGRPVQVDYAGPQGQYVGLDQVNLRLDPSLAGLGPAEVRLEFDGHPAQPVLVNIG